jgi:hypothetical protein
VYKRQVYTSAESKGSQAEYVRDGINYDKWMSNIKKILDNTDSRVCVMTTINILSLPTFNEFVYDIMKLRVKYNPGLKINRIPLSVNYLRFPPHLQVTLLESSVRNEYAEKIERHFEQWTKRTPGAYLWEYHQIQRFCEYMRTDQTSGPKYRKNFVDFIKQFDKRRGKNFSETFPEFAHLLIEWDNYDHE